MDALKTVIDRLPAEAASIRHHYWRDPDFRGLCHDYREALDVLARLEQATPPHAARIAEYRELAAELLAEVAETVAHHPERSDARS